MLFRYHTITHGFDHAEKPVTVPLAGALKCAIEDGARGLDDLRDRLLEMPVGGEVAVQGVGCTAFIKRTA